MHYSLFLYIVYIFLYMVYISVVLKTRLRLTVFQVFLVFSSFSFPLI